MSTSVSTGTPGTLNPTRQQLDELDALLKRMLELPVDQFEDTDDAEAENGADELTLPALSARPPRKEKELNREFMEMEPAAPPVSYMVVETAGPRPLPAASGFETQPSAPGPRLMPVMPRPEDSPEEEEVPSSVAPPEQALPVEAPSTEAEVWVPLRSTWQPSAQTWQPLAESWQQANGATPAAAPLPSPIPNPHLDFTPPAPDPIEAVQRLALVVGQASRPSADTADETPVPLAAVEAPPSLAPVETPIAPVEPRLSLSEEDAPVSVSPLLLPLLWFNQGFDACVVPLGDPGRWLSGYKGRRTLGVVGGLCLVAAMAILIGAGMGWTW